MPESLVLGYLWGGRATYPPGSSLGPRVLEDFELVWVVAGQATYVLEGRELAASPGSILLTRPGFRETYRWDATRSTRHAFLHFAVEELPADWPSLGDWPVLRAMAPGDPVRPLFRHVLDAWCDGTRSRERPPRSICRLVEAIVETYLAPAAAGGEHAPPVVQRVLEWAEAALDENPARRISLSELAASAAVTPKHLCRVFARFHERSPMDAVRSMRLERSLVLLARSNSSVQDIARSTGFSSPYHFSRSFKAAYGRPPTVVRHALLAGEPPPALAPRPPRRGS